MSNYKAFKKKLLKDQEIKKAYKDLGPEFAVVAMIIEKRLKEGLTQKELARKAQTKQPVISRLERGEFSPSLQFLYRITEALDAKLKISIS
jgi:predicted transcriptional regulator